MSILTSEISGDGCVLNLPFNEGSGTIAYDRSGYNNNSTIYGATWTSGVTGFALSFDGENDYVEVPDSPELRPTEWTVIMWAKSFHPVGGDLGYYPFMLSKYRNDTAGCWLFIDRYNQKFGIGTGDGTRFKELLTEVLDNNWHMLTGQLNSNKLIAYFDLNRYEITLDLTPAVSTHNLMIGTSTLTYGPFNGIIDSVRIYNRALSREEIQAHFRGARLLPLRGD